MNDLLESALKYADDGWRVLPLHGIVQGRCTCGAACSSPGKHPITKNGLNDATTDPDIITGWWTEHPYANIGVRTGAISDLYVLDVDNKRTVPVHEGSVIRIPEGEDSLAKLQSEYEPLPETRAVRTGSGGRHEFYRYPTDVEEGATFPNRAGMLPGLDIRGDGGYVVVPPSLHYSGFRYEWIDPDIPIVRPPEWLARYQGSERNSEFTELPVVVEGGRNDYLYRYGAHLLAIGRTHQEVSDAVFGANFRICKPPLDVPELNQIIRSLTDLPEVTNGQLDLDNFTGAKVSASTDEGDEEVGEGLDLAIPLWSLIEDPPDPLLPIIGGGILDEGNGFILAGQPNLGKSWIAFDAALSVASGTDFLGRFPTTQGAVLIVDEEGSRYSTYNRMKMLLKDRDYGYDLPIFHSIQKGVKLDTPRGQHIVQRMVERYRPRLMIFDSMVRLHSGDENSSRDMARLFEFPKRLQDAYGVAIVFLHHTRKPSKDDINDPGNLMRGSGDIRGWPDGILVALPRESEMYAGVGLTLHHVKSRDHEKLHPFRVGIIVDNDEEYARVSYQGSKREDEQHEQDRRVVADALRVGEWVTAAKVAIRAGMAEVDAVGILAELHDENRAAFRAGKEQGKTVQLWSVMEVQQDVL